MLETINKPSNVEQDLNPRDEGVQGPDFEFSFRSRGFSERIAASKVAARLNAANVSETEQNALLRERADLLKKRMTGQFSSADANRLAYVRWSLDRIDDAKHGQQLDALELAVERYQIAVNDLASLNAAVRKHLPGKR